MQTDRMQHILLSLLRAGLWGEAPSVEGFPLSAEEWKQLFFESVKQTVQGVVFDGIQLLPSDCLPPEEIRAQLQYAVQEIELKYLQHLKLISYLSIRFELEAGLSPVILKGLGLAIYYPHPNHRVVGDVDFYFGGPANSEIINVLMERWGNRVQRGEDDESVFMMNNVVLENHGRLITSFNPWVKKHTKAILEKQIAAQTAFQTVTADKIPLKVLIPLHNHLLLLTHSLKHVLNSGIGIRQLCDVAMLLKAEKANTDGNVLRRWLEEWGIYRWACLVYAFCVKYLGTPVEHLPFTFQLEQYDPTILLHEVWQSGNFGQMDERMAKRAPEGDPVFTAKRIFGNAWRFLKFAPGDAIGLPLEYTLGYIKKKLTGNK